MYIPLERDSPVPLARQIASYLAELVRRKHLVPGAKLPATRVLARSLGVARTTVDAAYRDLAARRMISVRPGQGATVRKRPAKPTEPGLPFRRPRGKDPLPPDAWLPAKDRPGESYDFAGDLPRLATLPSRHMKSLHAEALATSRGPLFAPAPPLGESTLRGAAAHRLALCGVLHGAEEVAIGADRAAIVAAVLALFAGRRSLVVADAPPDPEIARAVLARPCRLRILPPGSSAETLEEALGRTRPRLLLVTSGRSRIPGSLPDAARRRALVDLAKKRGLPVLEDVTDLDTLREPGAPPPLASMDSSGRVMALIDLCDEAGGRFHAAAIGAPARVLDRLRADSPSPALDRLSQRALALAIDTPARNRLLDATREQRHLLATSVARTIRRRMPSLAGVAFASASDAVRLDLPEGVPSALVRDAAARADIRVLTEADCGLSPEEPGFLLLDLLRHDEGDLLLGIARLGEIVESVVRNRDAGGALDDPTASG
ncbi:MAG: GntR family transcriptional regulator [Gemmatimonadota bacterium]|nr:GntR family transcriptional regulator [Gemmatimonadota bacterium]MDP6802238.1 GntR family transcriptional regulator [Gemmatimonadota bacterium]MDP7032159.1 GntR family transcriptional regulator [Gemmatimonadota bacterium]